ncbi:MAG: energy transducer TonB [Gammaproteobacteria bacterium]
MGWNDRQGVVVRWWKPAAVFVAVSLAHVGLFAGVVWLRDPVPPKTELPTITGILVKAPPAEVVKPPAAVTPPPQPVKPPEPVRPPEPVKSPPPPKPKPKPKPLPAPAPQPEPARPVPTPAPQPQPATPAPTAAPAAQPSEVAAPVVPPRVDASALNNPKPAYPSMSRRRGEEGTVMLELLVLKDGSVGDIRVKESSGYPRLDRSALEAVRRWRYTPAQQGGKPIEYRYLQPITFGLRDR